MHVRMFGKHMNMVASFISSDGMKKYEFPSHEYDMNMVVSFMSSESMKKHEFPSHDNVNPATVGGLIRQA